MLTVPPLMLTSPMCCMRRSMPWKLASARQIAASATSELARHRDRRQRVAHVVGAGMFSITGSAPLRPGSVTLKRLPLRSRVSRWRARPRPRAGHRSRTAGDARQDALDLLIVAAQHRQAVERQVVQELDEALLELVEVAAVVPR
jgi:hypothetical protein